MKKTKKLVLLFGVALSILMPVTGLFPILQGTASARVAPEGGGGSGKVLWWDQATVDERVSMYQYIMAMASCVKTQGGDVERGIDNIENYEFFSKGKLNDGNTHIGVMVAQQLGRGDDADDGGDGKLGCAGDDGQAINEAFVNLLGSTGIVSEKTGIEGANGDPLVTACYLGWDDKDGKDSDPASKCIKAKDRLMVPGDEKGFIKRLMTDLAGSTQTNVYQLLNDADRYYFWSQSFTAGCFTKRGDIVGPYGGADVSASDTNRVDNGDPNYFKLDWITADGEVVPYIMKSPDNDHERTDKKIIAALSNLETGWNVRCDEMVKNANSFSAKAASYFKSFPEEAGIITNNGTGISGNGTDLGSDERIDLLSSDCGGFELKDNVFGQGANLLKSTVDWIVCGFVKTASDAVRGFDNAIAGMLCVNESDIFTTEVTCSSEQGSASSRAGFYTAWNTFRILALSFLIIGGLIMIISQALGFEIVDAYTVKKVLPRLLFAGIAIALSWQFLEFIVRLSNGLGIGVRALIYAPFLEAGVGDVTIGSGEFGVGAVLGVGGFTVFGALGLLSFVGTALLAILIAFLVIVIRNILVILLIIIAPLAIASYVLPNTEKYMKTWWDWLFKALLMFPIITAFIAIGHVFAAITSEKGGNFSGFIALAAYVAPYFLIPLTFRLAGGAIATIGGFANDRSRGGFDRLKKFRAGRAAYNTQRMRDGERFNNAGLNRLTARASTARLGFGAQGRAAYDQKMAIAAMRHAKSDQGQAGQHNDGMLRAQTYESEAQARARMANDWGMDQASIDNSISAARANGGFGRSRQVYAAKRLSETGTGYDNLEQVAETVARVSNGNEGIMADVAGSINSSTKTQGRHGLAPGYNNLVTLSQQAHAGTATMADYHAATVAASRGTDAITLLRDKPQDAANLTNALGDHARAQHLRIQNAQTNQERAAATDEFLMTMGQIDQMNQGKSYASTEVQTHVNTLLEDTQDLRGQALDNLLGRPRTTPGPNGQPVSDPDFELSQITQEQVNNRERYDQVRSPRYNPNDPNNP